MTDVYEARIVFSSFVWHFVAGSEMSLYWDRAYSLFEATNAVRRITRYTDATHKVGRVVYEAPPITDCWNDEMTSLVERLFIEAGAPLTKEELEDMPLP